MGSGTLRKIFLLIIVVCIAGAALAQSKEAQEKYYKALKELDWRKGGHGRGYYDPYNPRYVPPNPQKAEKLFNEAAAVAPDWPLPTYGLGDLNYVLGKYVSAAEAYSKARAIDDKKKQLDNDQRHDLLNQLGLSYALARKYKEARQVYESALKEDDAFPLYHYNLACVYAETKDLDNALSHLKLAWEHRENMPSDIEFPDPRKDSSFEEYLDDPAFKEAVEAMVI